MVGYLETDGITRRVASLLMTAESYIAEGISCWIYLGSYHAPPTTVTDDLARDIWCIGEINDTGEIAIADRRSLTPTALKSARMAKKARVAVMLAGKAGILNPAYGR